MITEFQGQYRWLSNFAPCAIFGVKFSYPSVEHAYMSAKNDSLAWKQVCSMGGHTAGQIKKLSRKVQLRPDWPTFKLIIMRAALNQKYNQEPYRSLLLNTGDKHIQEGNYWNDKFWGVCLKTGVGENTLGKMIMEIRSQIQGE